MMHGALLGLAAVAGVTSPARVVNPTDTAKTAREILRGCGASEAQSMSAADDDWTPVISVEAKHAALRQSLNEPMPISRSMVSIHAIGGDLATTEFSVVLTRGVDGAWSGTAVGQSKVWIEGAKPSVMPRKSWTISELKGRRLDALLNNKCFYAEPTTFYRSQAPGVGVLFIDVEAQTPSHQRRFSYKDGHVEGLSKEVTELTFPPTS